MKETSREKKNSKSIEKGNNKQTDEKGLVISNTCLTMEIEGKNEIGWEKGDYGGGGCDGGGGGRRREKDLKKKFINLFGFARTFSKKLGLYLQLIL